MSDVIFEDIVFDRRSDNIAGALIAALVAGLLYAGLAFMIGDKGPSGFAESAPVVLILGLIAGYFGFKKKSSSKSVLRIKRSPDAKYHFEILSPSGKEALSFGSPFAYRCGWDVLNFGKGKRQRRIFFAFSDTEGKSLLTLQYFLGVLDPLPEGWPELTTAEVVAFEKVYRCDKLKVIADHFIYK